MFFHFTTNNPLIFSHFGSVVDESIERWMMSATRQNQSYFGVFTRREI